jgi:hypothetical protein
MTTQVLEGLPCATHVSFCPEPTPPRELPALLGLSCVSVVVNANRGQTGPFGREIVNIGRVSPIDEKKYLPGGISDSSRVVKPRSRSHSIPFTAPATRDSPCEITLKRLFTNSGESIPMD